MCLQRRHNSAPRKLDTWGLTFKKKRDLCPCQRGYVGYINANDKETNRNSRGWQGIADSGFWDLLKLPNLCMRWQGLEGKSPWTESEDKALLLTPAPTLAMPNVAKPFYLSVDEKKAMAKVVLINPETWALTLSCGLLTREIRSSGWWASLLENYFCHCPTN